MDRAEFEAILDCVRAGDIAGFEPSEGERFTSLDQRATADGHGRIHVLRHHTDQPLSAVDYARRVASTVSLGDGATFEGYPPDLPKSRVVGHTPTIPFQPGQPVPLDPPPEADADRLAFCTRIRSIPNDMKTGDYSGDVPWDKPQPEFTVGIYLAGIEVQARALVRRDPTITVEEAIDGAVIGLQVHETFHFARNLADLRYGARVEHAPTVEDDDLRDMEEALANAFAARALSGAVKLATIAIDTEGGLPGYSNLGRYLLDEDFKAGCIELGRRRYGEEHKNLLWEIITEDNYSMMPIVVLEPTNGGCALAVDSLNYYDPVRPYTINEIPW